MSKSRRGLVLLVDDDASVRSVIDRHLNALGWGVIPSGSAEDALRILDGLSDQLDLVLTDLSMPGADGFALAAEVTRRYPRVAVLYMTGGCQSVDPAQSVLRKPFSRQTLATAIAHVLDRGWYLR